MKCVVCGKLIPKARLEALPKTKTCVGCSTEQRARLSIDHTYCQDNFDPLDEIDYDPSQEEAIRRLM